MAWWKEKKKKKKKKKKKQEILERGAMLLEDVIECCDGKSNPIKVFTADEINKATNNFNDSNNVSELYTYSYHWYSGTNKNHQKLLINKFYRYRQDKYCRDIAVSSMVSGHKNFLKLVGCCLEFEYPVIVYQGDKKHYKLDFSDQSWKKRKNIAEDIVTALAYLHTAFSKPFVYRSFSLENVILDEDGVAKLFDFSECISIPKGETFVKVDNVVGTYNYLDDRYVSSGVVSEETDVFAIGVLMQKLLMGEKRFFEIFEAKDDEEEEEEEEEEEANDEGYFVSVAVKYNPMNFTGRRLHFKVLRFMEERRMDEIADPEMGEISEQELFVMKAFLMLSLRCVGHRGEVPTMVEVAKELKKIQRSLRNDSSSPLGETQFDSAQDISSSVVLLNQT